MMEIRNEPILTDVYDAVADFVPLPSSTYLFGQSREDRSAHISAWSGHCSGVELRRIHHVDQLTFHVDGATSEQFGLRSEADLTRFWQRYGGCDRVYIDITGLSHSVWAPLLRVGLSLGKTILVVYVEPNNYKRSAAPREGQIYDLSNSIGGIVPLPGFAVLSDRSDDDFILVATLGFEGARLSHMIEHIQPAGDRVIPIIGCPGFKPWYIFEAYVGNKRFLSESRAWNETRFAPGNCPFSCYYLLNEIAETRGLSALKVALVGTKPHALGAVLFYLLSDDPVELIYDHPSRAENRTDGTERLLAYHVSAFSSVARQNGNLPKRLRLRGP